MAAQQNLELTRVEEQEEEADGNQPEASKTKSAQKQRAAAPYRTPEFVWSRVHIRLLDDLLTYIEKVVEEWSDSSTAMVDHVCSNLI